MSDISDFLDWISWIAAQKNQYELNKKNEKFQKLVTKLQNIVRGVDHFLQHKLGVGLPSEWLERAGLKEPAKKAPQRPQERSERQHDELDGPSLWIWSMTLIYPLMSIGAG